MGVSVTANAGYGIPLGGIPLGGIPLGGIPLGGIPLGGLPMAGMSFYLGRNASVAGWRRA